MTKPRKTTTMLRHLPAGANAQASIRSTVYTSPTVML